MTAVTVTNWSGVLIDLVLALAVVTTLFIEHRKEH